MFHSRLCTQNQAFHVHFQRFHSDYYPKRPFSFTKFRKILLREISNDSTKHIDFINDITHAFASRPVSRFFFFSFVTFDLSINDTPFSCWSIIGKGKDGYTFSNEIALVRYIERFNSMQLYCPIWIYMCIKKIGI